MRAVGGPVSENAKTINDVSLQLLTKVEGESL